MARNAAGNYSLPSGNPITSGSTVQSAWANTTLTDLSAEVTDSLSRSGKGGMLAALLLVNGASASPGIAFSSEVSSGIYRAGASDVRFVLGGSDRIRMKSGAGASALEFSSPQAGAGVVPDFVFDTVNLRTAGSLWKLATGGVERLRIDSDGSIYQNGALFTSGGGGTSTPWTTKFLAADATVGAAASDLTGMSFAMEANSKYIVRAVLVGLSGDAAEYGVTFRMKGSGAPTIGSMLLMSLQDDTGGAAQSQEVSAVDTDWFTGTTTPGSGTVRTTWGVINTGGSAGTFQLQGRRTGGTADPAIRAGSYIEYHKV